MGIVSQYDPSKGRYVVSTEEGNTPLRRENIQQIVLVSIEGLKDSLALNGNQGYVYKFDESRGRYLVKWTKTWSH